MLVTERRPRDLRWFHAGPLLFGDWGTSRLYVLGLSFYYVGHASLAYLLVMSLIMAGVAWAYTIVCRAFPDGGGVYAAARRINPTLSVIGATLLLCDYIVTAALSAVEGFHYFGAHSGHVVGLCIVIILALGVVNWFGARSAGRLALGIAVSAIVASLVLGALCLPWLGEGLSRVVTTVPGVDSWGDRWESLVRIVLALSGVEAVANMTGLMRQPVARTSRRTIWPVLIEVVTLNLIFGIALNAMPNLASHSTPDYVAYELRQGMPPDAVPPEVKEYRDTAVKLLATTTAGHALGAEAGRWFGLAAGVVFGLLLLSAVNTAIMAMVSVMYAMARDRELPRFFTGLNYSGVPRWGLAVACVLPIGVLAFEADVKALGELYAIGVVGAIAINLVSCAANRELDVRRWERAGLWALGGLMCLIELTIIVAKPNATIFASMVVASVLVLRAFVTRRAATPPQLPEPATGWLAQLPAGPVKIDPSKPRILLAARGRYQSEFAVDLARRRKATLLAISIRTLRVMDMRPGSAPELADDPAALEALGTTAVLASRAGVDFVPIYVTSTDIADEILDAAASFGCDTLIMGKSKRSLFARRIEGDVIARVAAHLPDALSLITRSPDQPFQSAIDEAATNQPSR